MINVNVEFQLFSLQNKTLDDVILEFINVFRPFYLLSLSIIIKSDFQGSPSFYQLTDDGNFQIKLSLFFFYISSHFFSLFIGIELFLKTQTPTEKICLHKFVYVLC